MCAVNNASSAPKCGKPFIGLLSTGEKVVMRHPKKLQGYFDFWEVEGAARVPMPESICTESREEFIHLIEWWPMPPVSGEAAAAINGMRDGRYKTGDM